jgi:malate dehydrogenase
VVITAGIPRKPGMSRQDLLTLNARIVIDATENAVKHSPGAIFIVMTNPLDTMAYLVMRVGRLPRERILGQAGILDSARMQAFTALEIGTSVENIACYVLGGHGDEMVPLTRHSNVAGVPLREYLPAEKLAGIIDRTRRGGGEIVDLLKTGSAYIAPAAAVAQMAEAILKDKHLIVPASVYMQGEYGLKDIFFGVPIQLGQDGMEKIIEYELDSDEKIDLERSAAAVKANILALHSLINI